MVICQSSVSIVINGTHCTLCDKNGVHLNEGDWSSPLGYIGQLNKN